MAIIKTNRTPYFATAALYEDPVPNSPYIFFQHDAYDKTTLAPQFDVGMNWNTLGKISYYAEAEGTNHSGFGYTMTNITYNTTTGTAGNFYSQAAQGTVFWPLTGIFMLNGETTHVRHYIFNTLQDYRNSLDISPFATMDPTRRVKATSYWTDGVNNVVWGVAHHNASNAARALSDYPKYWLKVNTSSQDLVNGQYVNQNTQMSTVLGGANQYQMWPIYRNPTTGNLVWTGQPALFSSSTMLTPYSMRGVSSGNAFVPTPTFTAPATSTTASYTSQFVGVGVDGYAIYLNNDSVTDYNQGFYKFNDLTNTNSILNTFTTIPSPGASSVGGNRALTFSGNVPKYASSTFTDPTTATNKGFYVPYLDTAGNYVPFYYQWNTLTDVFSRNATNCTMTYSSGTFGTRWSADTQSGTAQANTLSGMQRLWANESFVYSGTRYLMFMQLHGAGGVYDGTPNQRTFVCYSMNPSNPLALTYHSSIVVPYTPKNIVWLNDARTVLGVICHNNFYIYTFNGTTWTQTANVPYQFYAVGRDNTGRIWGIDPGPGYGRMHLISSTTPVSITVTPASTNYQYTGSTITTSVAVNAYNSAGARIVTSVKLVINGGSMTFANSNLTTTITTSASVDTTVSVYITNGGVSNIVASAAI